MRRMLKVTHQVAARIGHGRAKSDILNYLTVLFRPHRTHGTLLLPAPHGMCDFGSTFRRLCVCVPPRVFGMLVSPAKTAEPIEMLFGRGWGGADSCGPKKPLLDGGTHRRHLTNTTARSVRDGDAASSQMICCCATSLSVAYKTDHCYLN